MGFQAILGEFLYPGTSFSISCGYPSAESWENWAVPADRDLPKNAKKVRLEERAHLCHSIFPGNREEPPLELRDRITAQRSWLPMPCATASSRPPEPRFPPPSS